MIRLEYLFGHIEIVTTSKWEGPYRQILGGYSITYDQHGKEVSRTQDTPNVVLEWPQPDPRRWWEFWK